MYPLSYRRNYSLREPTDLQSSDEKLIFRRKCVLFFLSGRPRHSDTKRNLATRGKKKNESEKYIRTTICNIILVGPPRFIIVNFKKHGETRCRLSLGTISYCWLYYYNIYIRHYRHYKYPDR